MEFDVIAVIKDLGVPVALVCYFLFKDWKFTSIITETLVKINETLEDIQQILDNTVSKGA